MITIYIVAYNEEIILPFTIDHYKKRFPNCNIIVYDNMSTDKTPEIAIKNGAKVLQFDTNNQINDLKYLEIKNNCWKNSDNNWVIVCDVDELLDINQEQLIKEANNGVSIIKSCGYNMVNFNDNLDIKSIKYGKRAPQYDKYIMFNKEFIHSINYEAGCHICNPVGTIKYSCCSYNLYHYHFINFEFVMSKYKRNITRLSKENIKHGWGIHYTISEQELKDKFDLLRRESIRVRE